VDVGANCGMNFDMLGWTENVGGESGHLIHIYFLHSFELTSEG
jgi:hypothetical protein